MIISQASILARVGEIDVSKKSRLFFMENKEFKAYQVETIKFKQIVIKIKEFNQDVGLKIMHKKTKLKLEDKVSLRVINKYQFRRDLDSNENIPSHEIIR